MRLVSSGSWRLSIYSSSQIRRPLSGSAVSHETPRFRQSVDRNSFRSPCRECDSGSVQPCPTGSTSMGTAIFRSSRGARYSQECSNLYIRFNICENCYKFSISISPAEIGQALRAGSTRRTFGYGRGRIRQPHRGFHALRERFSPLQPARGMFNLAIGSTSARTAIWHISDAS